MRLTSYTQFDHFSSDDPAQWSVLHIRQGNIGDGCSSFSKRGLVRIESKYFYVVAQTGVIDEYLPKILEIFRMGSFRDALFRLFDGEGILPLRGKAYILQILLRDFLRRTDFFDSAVFEHDGGVTQAVYRCGIMADEQNRIFLLNG